MRKEELIMGNCCRRKKRASIDEEDEEAQLTFGSSSEQAKELKRQRIIRENMTQLVHQVVDKKDFEKQLKEAGSKLVVVDFFATWCGPCKVISPKINELAKSNPDVIFLKVDVDDNEQVASEQGISSMPTFFFFKDGKKVDEFSGANEKKLIETINKYK